MLLVSTRKGLFALDQGKVVGTSFLGDNVTLACRDAENGWYAALNLGHFGTKLKFSPDGGKTWEDRAVPAFAEGDEVKTGDGKPPVPATLKLIWELVSDGSRLWAGTIPGGLFRSDDGARSWELVRGLWDRPERAGWFGGGYDQPGIHSILAENGRLRLAVSCGGVWSSLDEGRTWSLDGEGVLAEYMPPEMRESLGIQDVHRMQCCAASPEHVWVQHHNGIFKSEDGGKTFTPVEPPVSGFGFGVAVHPRDPRTAWFVPAIKDERRVPVDGALAVTRTRDGGRTWDVLRNGLPQVHAYDLVYRHALAVDTSGDRLAIGSTTGGVWLSDDGGDTWRAAEGRLPPVHAVCFV